MTSNTNRKFENLGRTTSQSNENEDEDVLKSMFEARDKVNHLLQIVSKSLLWKRDEAILCPNFTQDDALPHHSITRNDIQRSSSNIVISHSDLANLHSNFQKESDGIAIRNALEDYISTKEKPSSHCTIPMTLVLQEGDYNMAIDLPPDETIMMKLAQNRYPIVIHGIIGEICELPKEENYYPIHDNNSLLLGTAEFQRIKETKRMEWEQQIGSLEHDRLSQRIFQVISELDLLLTEKDIDAICSLTLSICVMWREKAYLLATKAVQKLLGAHSSGSFIIGESSEKLSSIHCHFALYTCTNFSIIGLMFIGKEKPKLPRKFQLCHKLIWKNVKRLVVFPLE